MKTLLKPPKKSLFKLEMKLFKFIVKTQFNRANPIYTTKDLLKVGLEVQQVVGLLSVILAGVYLVKKLYFMYSGHLKCPDTRENLMGNRCFRKAKKWSNFQSNWMKIFS
jgi:hypothetical protein